MSGGGGGIIIIKHKVRELVETDAVKDELTGWRRNKFDEILAKAESDWTKEETHFLLRCAGFAFDEHCGAV